MVLATTSISRTSRHQQNQQASYHRQGQHHHGDKTRNEIIRK